ncbi:hypothetical protein OG730_38505 [Streptomyces sp. NBC_01298]|uniref:hypothetical protein n=1 Tax=Streptomyces sp. NBC_01298 TaxID=2903817 RepID=UPI002E1497B9|nr:hypothetical protein OG730_38505 [Streptomyces sp. NBC_01298]
MKIVIAQDHADLSRTAADVVLGEMLHDRRVNMALTAGASPAGTYEIVTDSLRRNPGRPRRGWAERGGVRIPDGPGSVRPRSFRTR